MTPVITEPNEREKIPVSISLLNNALFEDEGFDSIVDTVTENSGYMEQRLRPLYTRGRQVRLFYARETKPARWVAFFKTALAPEQPMLKAQNRIASFVCFVGAGSHTFVLNGGLGKFLVQEYLDPNFGMDILVRLIKKDSPSVRSLQDRGVTGAVLGENRFFRGRQRLTDEDQFGKIYKEINAVLNNKILLQELGFSPAEVTRRTAGCWAKSSFLVGKSIGFGRMISLVERLNTILAKAANFSLNSVILIRNRGDKNKNLLEQLFEQLKLVLYEDCRNERMPDFDFCHSDFETYLMASSFCINIGGEDDMVSAEPIGLADMISHFKEKDRWTIDTPGQFDIGILRRKLISYDDGGIEETSGTILEHLHGEMSWQGQRYFFLDRQWYQIENAYVTALNIQCQALIDQYLDEHLLTLPYDIRKEERIFTDQYFGHNGCLVLDTIIEEHIEACDLLMHDTETLHLVHVKRGFNNSMRELAAQVSLAARRIAQDILSDLKYITAIGNQARSGRNSGNLRLQQIASQSFPPGGLAALFQGRKLGKIVFCVAFADQSDQARHIKTDLQRFESNMAKYSLVQLSQDVRKHGFEFKVVQLQKP